jgi:hypothetical protein
MIEVDLTGAVPAALHAYPDALALIIPDLVEECRSEIIRLAQQDLTSSADDYVQGVQPPKYHFARGKLPDTEAVVATIVLLGDLPNMIEKGWPGGDMKPGLLGGRAVKMGKNGPYTVVPFRHATPGTTGRAGGVMGSQHERVGKLTEEQAKKLGNRIHKRAKALMQHKAAGPLQEGQRRRLQAGLATKLAEHHKTDIFAGMIRQVQPTKRGGTQSTYHTFRTVSGKSDPKAWIHPGIEPREFFKQAGSYIDKIAPRLLEKAVNGVAE